MPLRFHNPLCRIQSGRRKPSIWVGLQNESHSRPELDLLADFVRRADDLKAALDHLLEGLGGGKSKESPRPVIMMQQKNSERICSSSNEKRQSRTPHEHISGGSPVTIDVCQGAAPLAAGLNFSPSGDF
jgi:hypothetical protein